MRRVHHADIVIRKSDWPIYKSIPNKREWLHEAIQAYAKAQGVVITNKHLLTINSEEESPMSHNVVLDVLYDPPPTHPEPSGLMVEKFADTDIHFPKVPEPLTDSLPKTIPTTDNSNNQNDIPKIIFDNSKKVPNQYEVKVIWPNPPQ